MPLRDDLQQSIEEWSAKDPQLPLLIRAFELNDGLISELAATRDRLGLTQREVARRMGTSQAAIDRFEDGDVDPRLSTVQRFAAALGKVVKWDVVEAVEDATLCSSAPLDDIAHVQYSQQLARAFEE